MSLTHQLKDLEQLVMENRPLQEVTRRVADMKHGVKEEVHNEGAIGRHASEEQNIANRNAMRKFRNNLKNDPVVPIFGEPKKVPIPDIDLFDHITKRFSSIPHVRATYLKNVATSFSRMSNTSYLDYTAAG